MKNEDNWKKSKFTFTDQELHVNKQDVKLGVQSYIITECIATLYSKYLPRFIKGDLLDLGCGMCPIYILYKKYSSSIFCVDWSNSLHANPYTDLECDITEPIPLNSDSFDSVILSDVLEHVSKPEKLLVEIQRLLRQDGYLILNVPFLYWIHESPNDFYRYTEFALNLLLRNSNFEVEVLEPIGGLLETWADITAKLTSYIPGIKHFVPWTLFSLVFLLRNVKFIKSRFEQLDKLFPLGYFVVARKL